MKVGPEMRPRENACRVPGTDEAPTYNDVVLSIKTGSGVILKKCVYGSCQLLLVMLVSLQLISTT